jgi:DUF1365 family protein
VTRREALASYDVTIGHHRRDGVPYAFTNRARTWLVDLDDVPELPGGLSRLCSFAARDHMGDGSRTLRENVDDWLRSNGIAPPASVRMLASPRVLGQVFNPLSLFYCHDAAGALTHVVAEVRNTYGGRRCYLLEPSADGRATTEKTFYVSPFHGVDGDYELRVPEPGDELAVTVTLRRPGRPAFVATMRGTRSPDARLATALRRPWANLTVVVMIRVHGIRLFLKGLRPTPRPEHQPDDSITIPH